MVFLFLHVLRSYVYLINKLPIRTGMNFNLPYTLTDKEKSCRYADFACDLNRHVTHFFLDEIEETDDVSRYVQSVMMPTITEGLSEMFKVNPSDPLRWFGNWLLTKSV